MVKGRIWEAFAMGCTLNIFSFASPEGVTSSVVVLEMVHAGGNGLSRGVGLAGVVVGSSVGNEGRIVDFDDLFRFLSGRHSGYGD